MPITLKTLSSILEIFKSYELNEESIVITVKDSELFFETPEGVELREKDIFSLAYHYGVLWCDKKKVFKRYVGEVREDNSLHSVNGIKCLKMVLDNIKDMTPEEYLKLLEEANKRREPNEYKRKKITS